MASVTNTPIPIAYVLRPLFGGDGCLRDYSDRISRQFLKNPNFHKLYAELTEEERVRRAQDGAQNILISEIQMHGMDYTYDQANDRGVLFVKEERHIPMARKRIDNLATRVAKLCGNRLRYQFAE